MTIVGDYDEKWLPGVLPKLNYDTQITRCDILHKNIPSYAVLKTDTFSSSISDLNWTVSYSVMAGDTYLVEKSNLTFFSHSDDWGDKRQ